jgi:hypothetical protein
VRRFLVLNFTLLLAVFVVGCAATDETTGRPQAGNTPVPTLAPTASPTGPSLGVTFQLGVNQTAQVGAEGLAMKLLEITEDSRCPLGVSCFWEGQATVVINATNSGRNLGNFPLTLRAGRDDLSTAAVNGYLIKLVALYPYPVAERRTRPEEYLASLVVSKK